MRLPAGCVLCKLVDLPGRKAVFIFFALFPAAVIRLKKATTAVVRCASLADSSKEISKGETQGFLALRTKAKQKVYILRTLLVVVTQQACQGGGILLDDTPSIYCPHSHEKRA